MNPKAVVTLFFVVAGLLVAGTVITAMVAPEALWFGGGRGCSITGLPAGQDIAPASDATVAERDGLRWRAVRTLTYSVPATGLDEVLACVDTGKLDLVAGAPGAFSVEARVTGHGSTEAGAREQSRVDPVVRAGGGALVAYDPPRAHQHWSDGGYGVTLRIVAPSDALLEATLHSDTGSVTVDGVRLRGLVAGADTGKVRLDPSWAEGTIAATTDTGSVEGRFPGLGAAELRFSTDTGAVRVWVPATARHGYDIVAATDTGRVTLDLPELDTSREEHRKSSSHQEARTRGYESREVKVRMQLLTDTGGITVAPV